MALSLDLQGFRCGCEEQPRVVVFEGILVVRKLELDASRSLPLASGGCHAHNISRTRRTLETDFPASRIWIALRFNPGTKDECEHPWPALNSLVLLAVGVSRRGLSATLIAQKGQCLSILLSLERVKGIEPSFQAWEAHVLPLNHTRADVPAFIKSSRTAQQGISSRNSLASPIKELGRAEHSPSRWSQGSSPCRSRFWAGRLP